jgi:hypothetical protein
MPPLFAAVGVAVAPVTGTGGVVAVGVVAVASFGGSCWGEDMVYIFLIMIKMII